MSFFFQRCLVWVAAIIGIGLAVFGLMHAWHSDTETLRARLYEILELATGIAMFGIAALIAWRAGQSQANLSIALALTAIHFSTVQSVVNRLLGFDSDVPGMAINVLFFGVGAALFVRATQHFPQRITAAVIAASTTPWGRLRIARATLSALLRPPLLWLVAFALAIFGSLTWWGPLGDLARLGIVALGIVYFHINYRAGDAETRRKVLWFLAAAIATAMVSLLVVAFLAVYGNGGSENLRTVVGVSLVSLDNLAHIICISAAVFYAGAISPLLVIRKTVVFGLTTTLLLFVFATAEVYLHHLIVHWLHVTDTLASSLIGGAFGLTFHPVKHYFEHLLERFHVRLGKTPAHHATG